MFGVSTDYLLNDAFESDADIPAVQASSSKLNQKYESRIWTFLGSGLPFAGLASFVILYIVSVHSTINYPSEGTGTEIDSASGFGVVVDERRLEWLVVLCIIVFISGLLIVIVPGISHDIKRRKKSK